MDERPHLIIGDLHGHYDRLHDLLALAGVIDSSTGERVDRERTVVCVGDIGHFGKSGSPTGDRLCWQAVSDWIDIALLGNHDIPLLSRRLSFDGYIDPDSTDGPRTRELVRGLVRAGTARLAYACHGHLITHAGLHRAFREMTIPGLNQHDPEAVASWLCGMVFEWDPPHPYIAVRDAVSKGRGGRVKAGGILWRDWREPLYDVFPQVCGHTARTHRVRTRARPAGDSHWCVDVGSPTNGRLAGLLLPERRIVAIDRPDW